MNTLRTNKHGIPVLNTPAASAADRQRIATTLAEIEEGQRALAAAAHRTSREATFWYGQDYE